MEAVLQQLKELSISTDNVLHRDFGLTLNNVAGEAAAASADSPTLSDLLQGALFILLLPDVDHVWLALVAAGVIVGVVLLQTRRP